MLDHVKPKTVNHLNGGFTEVVIDCPFCGNEHRHGNTNLPGPRTAHCADNADGTRQYLVEAPDPE